MIESASKHIDFSNSILVRSRSPRSWYNGSKGTQGAQKGVKEGVTVPLTPTFLGSFLLRMEAEKGSKKGPRSYRQAYPRTLKTSIRRLRAVEYLRYRYHLSLNIIARGIGCNVRTVWLDVQLLRKFGAKAFDAARRLHRRSKKMRGLVNRRGAFLSWKTLSARLRAFILGLIDSIEEALGDDPP